MNLRYAKKQLFFLWLTLSPFLLFGQKERSSNKELRPDKVYIEYWCAQQANTYHYRLTHDTLFITDKRFDYSSQETEDIILKRMAKYIDMFYVSKTDSIIIGKTNEPDSYAEWETIEVTVWQNGKKQKRKHEITDQYVFHPEFLNFWKFLYKLPKL